MLVLLAMAAGGAAAVSPEQVIENVGHPSQDQIALAGELRRSIPENLYAAAHSPIDAYLLSHCIDNGPKRARSGAAAVAGA